MKSLLADSLKFTSLQFGSNILACAQSLNSPMLNCWIKYFTNNVIANDWIIGPWWQFFPLCSPVPLRGCAGSPKLEKWAQIRWSRTTTNEHVTVKRACPYIIQNHPVAKNKTSCPFLSVLKAEPGGIFKGGCIFQCLCTYRTFEESGVLTNPQTLNIDNPGIFSWAVQIGLLSLRERGISLEWYLSPSEDLHTQVENHLWKEAVWHFLLASARSASISLKRAKHGNGSVFGCPGHRTSFHWPQPQKTDHHKQSNFFLSPPLNNMRVKWDNGYRG